jgi:hypothetical protein
MSPRPRKLIVLLLAALLGVGMSGGFELLHAHGEHGHESSHGTSHEDKGQEEHEDCLVCKAVHVDDVGAAPHSGPSHLLVAVVEPPAREPALARAPGRAPARAPPLG